MIFCLTLEGGRQHFVRVDNEDRTVEYQVHSGLNDWDDLEVCRARMDLIREEMLRAGLPFEPYDTLDGGQGVVLGTLPPDMDVATYVRNILRVNVIDSKLVDSEEE